MKDKLISLGIGVAILGPLYAVSHYTGYLINCRVNDCQPNLLVPTPVIGFVAWIIPLCLIGLTWLVGDWIRYEWKWRRRND